MTFFIVSWSEQGSRRAIVLSPALVFALALASAPQFCVKVFKTSLFPNPWMDLVYIWYDDRYWSKILFSTIPTPMHDLKVQMTKIYISVSLLQHYFKDHTAENCMQKFQLVPEI